ncbi:hypothetical protein CDL12_15150 [Handroanthus impetiginosus]|uniref:Golgin candidate 5 n=1 Tax=Handroanthus impetiginosus TaxID=429701 RepID=A0A2G9H3Z5_9LAMI|nr:hypothetical protein CDL12_15150 [Handroanthus impetiginosus]
MAWFSGKVSLGNFPDFAGAVNKLSESVKNIEKNFDSALGLEEKSDAAASENEVSGLWPSAMEGKALFEPIIGFMGQKGDESTVESLEKSNDDSAKQATEQIPHVELANDESENADVEAGSGEVIRDTSGEPKENAAPDHVEAEVISSSVSTEESEQKPEEIEQIESGNNLPEEERSEEISPAFLEPVQPESANNLLEELRSEKIFPSLLESAQPVFANNLQKEEKSEEMSSKMSDSLQPESTNPVGKAEVFTSVSTIDEATNLPESLNEQNAGTKDIREVFPAQSLDALPEGPAESSGLSYSDIPDKTRDAEDDSTEKLPVLQYNDVEASKAASDFVTPLNDTVAKSIEIKQRSDKDANIKEQHLNTGSNWPDVADSVIELEKVKKEMKMMETALHGAARQAQVKADEIAKLMNENEQLKAVIEDLRRTNEAESESLREEYHQRVAALERKVYALTKERDTLRREQSKKNDAAALLKEKDEIITQVMAEGEELSKKQAAQESHIRKLRAQIRELEEEKKGLLTKLQVEENKVESIKTDKAAT